MARSQTTYQIFYGRKGKDAPMVYQAGTDIAPAKPTYYALPYVGSDGWSQVTPGTTTEKPVLWSCAGKWQGDSIVWGVPVRLNGKDAHTHVLYADSSPLADAPSEITSSVYFIKDGKLPITGNEQYILLECAVKTAHAQELYACIYALNLEVTHEWIGSRGENKTIEASTSYQKVTFLLKVSDVSNGYHIHFGFYHRDLGTTGGSSVSYEISLKNISVTLLENFNAHSGNYRGEYSSFLASGSENPLDYSWNKLQGSQGASLFFAGVWDPDIEYVSTRYRIDWVKYRRGGKWEFYERKEDNAYTVGTPPYSSSTSEINPGWKFIEEQQLKYVRSLITEEVRVINDLGDVIAGVNKDNYAFWSGAELPENANFWVDKNGRMHAIGGTFDGSISTIVKAINLSDAVRFPTATGDAYKLKNDLNVLTGYHRRMFARNSACEILLPSDIAYNGAMVTIIDDYFNAQYQHPGEAKSVTRAGWGTLVRAESDSGILVNAEIYSAYVDSVRVLAESARFIAFSNAMGDAVLWCRL